jgi:hypothetical protein
MKAVLRRRIAPPLKSEKKVATVHAPNPQATKDNVRSSWADSIAGNEYVPTFNQSAVFINSYNKKLGSSVPYGKSMHTKYFSSPKLKPATGQSNEKLFACVSPKLK